LIVALAWVAGRRCDRRRIGTIFSENRPFHAPRPTSIRTYDSVFKDRAEVTFRLGGQESRGRCPTCQTQFQYFSTRCPKGGLVATSIRLPQPPGVDRRVERPPSSRRSQPKSSRKWAGPPDLPHSLSTQPVGRADAPARTSLPAAIERSGQENINDCWGIGRQGRAPDVADRTRLGREPAFSPPGGGESCGK
jgi:hypothetical protein